MQKVTLLCRPREFLLCLTNPTVNPVGTLRRHKFFNTNNLWVNLDKLAATIEANGGLLKLPLIKNKKTVNPRDSESTPVRALLHSALDAAPKMPPFDLPCLLFQPCQNRTKLVVHY